MDEKIQIIAAEFAALRVKENVDLSEHIYSKKKITAKAFFIATSERELVKMLTLCRNLKAPFFVIGVGSKFDFNDGVIDGLVIKNRHDSIKIAGIKGNVSRNGLGVNEVIMEVGSGLTLKGLNDFLKKQHMQTLKTLDFGIGSLGGSLRFDKGLQSVADKVKVLDEEDNIQLKDVNQIIPTDIFLSVFVRCKTIR